MGYDYEPHFYYPPIFYSFLLSTAIMLKIVTHIRQNIIAFKNSIRPPFTTLFEPQFIEINVQSDANANSGRISLSDLFQGLWHMGVPKSKVSFYN